MRDRCHCAECDAYRLAQGENYFRGAIVAGRVGQDQAAPVSES
jgi:hypothetical protein